MPFAGFESKTPKFDFVKSLQSLAKYLCIMKVQKRWDKVGQTHTAWKRSRLFCAFFHYVEQPTSPAIHYFTNRELAADKVAKTKVLQRHKEHIGEQFLHVCLCKSLGRVLAYLTYI